jgi:hypothetical protein
MARSTGDPQGKGAAFRAKIEGRQREERRRNRHKGDVADYANVSPNALHSSITAVTSADCAIQFGYTKDGTTFVVRIVGDGEPYNEFIRPSENMDEYLTALAADYTKER